MTLRWAVKRCLLAYGIQFADKAMREIFGFQTPVSLKFHSNPEFLLQGLEPYRFAIPLRGTQWMDSATQNVCQASPQRRTYAGRLLVLPGPICAAQLSAWLLLQLVQEVLN
jgi:uncharacterized protein YecE (DUF72 family)